MLKRTFDLIVRGSPGLRRLMTKLLYQMLTELDRDSEMTFMNYGYAYPNSDVQEITLSQEDRVNYYCIQLYNHVVGAIDLRAEEVLEVGCGRGGGASYVIRYLKPKSLLGVDICEKAVEFCKSYYSINGLSFCQGDAESLGFADNSFDAVVNIESSHGYGSMQQFLREVFRVLRPNGYFLYADHRGRDKISLLRRELKDSGLRVLREEDITANVVRALDLDNERKLELINRKCPKIINRGIREFAAMRGTRAYEAFKSRESYYLSYVLQKSEVAN
jgi:ubiquinone/menaquinone biosynthesis C-methylase UbiE